MSEEEAPDPPEPEEPDVSVSTLQTFLENEYADDIETAAEDGDTSVYVEYADLKDTFGSKAREFVTSATRTRRFADEALRLYCNNNDIDRPPEQTRLIDTEDEIESVSPPEVESTQIADRVAISGQIDHVSGKKPLLEEAAWECRRCGSITRIPQPRLKLQKPHECQGCEESGAFGLNTALSEFTDQRKVKIKTPPDVAAQSEEGSIAVFVKGDLCDVGGPNGLSDRAGARCTVFGTVEIDDSDVHMKGRSPDFDKWYDAESFHFHEEDFSNLDIDQHIDAINECLDRDDPITFFRDQIAPGLELDKDLTTALEAAVAWLFGSYRVDVAEGTYRGDLHMGLIGDPGTGKSSALSAIADIMPKGEIRSGTDISKAGLTTAAIREEFAGKSEFVLKPGILPRCNGGHCIIDEFDAVVDENTKAIHDALEGDQKIRADKAGIKADLPTRTAVMVAGNPDGGRFDKAEPVKEQIDMDPAMISRLDVLLDITDSVNKKADSKKADHYLNSFDELSRKEVFQRGETDEEPELATAGREVDTEVLKAWVAHHRQTVFPLLTDEAKESLRDFYLEVRNLNDGYDNDGVDLEPVPVTLRSLGAGVRLAIGFARCEGSDTVEERHTERAKKISRSVVGLNFDAMSGMFDSASVDEGSMDREPREIKIIKGLEKKTGEPVPHGEAVAAICQKLMKDPEYVNNRLEKFRQRGDIYEPNSDGEYRAT